MFYFVIAVTLHQHSLGYTGTAPRASWLLQVAPPLGSILAEKQEKRIKTALTRRFRGFLESRFFDPSEAKKWRVFGPFLTKNCPNFTIAVV